MRLIFTLFIASVLVVNMMARLRAETIKVGGTGGAIATMQRLADA